MAGQDFYTDPAQEAVHPEARLPQRPGKRRMRWTDQHTKILILGIVLAALLVGTIIYAIAKQKKPDYTLGLITSYSMPETGVMQIEDLLGRFADDRNGDGTVRVEVVNYVFSDSETLQGLQKASQQALEQDLAEGTSLLFLHDQEGFQKVAGEFAGLLQDREGNPLGEEAAELEAAAVPWEEVAALAELEPEAAENDAWSAEDYGEKFQALRLSVRSEEGLSTPEAQAYYEDCQALLERLEQNEPLVIEEDPPWMDELLSELEEEQAQA